ncbi:type III-B CRISPR module-associated protein Cmr5 [Nocardiopsis sp. RSe5-2]|uniref:CRISPR type III-B/RAMP module-associated protein Cmr5 n=1 Tax=Nocardiopsis endophytica TaxID=3018445 RepID=A0ABT4U6H3_9ACTN|nr:type III-B CRISPR module-associated protein Cmr5 [Nocardiopsis endophytica]MDA2812549.1 type III-B CRISPR module-associated protein Cmr5 [Nocardiopsis endophytica]
MSGAVRIDQELASIAYEILPERVTKEVRTRMRQLPSRLRGGGLAATYAFICARANDSKAELGQAYGLLADKIAQRLADQRILGKAGDTMTRQQCLRHLAEATPIEYARASAEIDALAIWLSRLSDALSDRSEDGGADAQG